MFARGHGRKKLRRLSETQGVLAAGADRIKDEVQPVVAGGLKGGRDSFEYTSSRRRSAAKEAASIMDHPQAWRPEGLSTDAAARPALSDLSNFAKHGPAGFCPATGPRTDDEANLGMPPKKKRVVTVATKKRSRMKGVAIELPVPANGRHYTLFEYLHVWDGLSKDQRATAESAMVDRRYVLCGTSTARRKYMIWTSNDRPSTLADYLACDGVRSIAYDGWGRRTGRGAFKSVAESDKVVADLKIVQNSTTSSSKQKVANQAAKKRCLEDKGYAPSVRETQVSEKTDKNYYALTTSAPEAIIRTKAMQQTDAR